MRATRLAKRDFDLHHHKILSRSSASRMRHRCADLHIWMEVLLTTDQFGPLCVGTKTRLTSESNGRHSEDCLFINVFAPTRATNDSLLPVYVFIQGGGFNINGNANYNGADLIDAGDDGMIVVNFNYRVGPSTLR